MPTKAHAAKLAYIKRLCLDADSVHAETAKLVASISGETLYVRSTRKLKPKPVRTPKH